MLIKKPPIFSLLVTLGVILRLGFVLAADSRQLTFHSGGSDAPAYVLLAENLVSHKGFTYAGQPTAFRPPGYPLLVAGFMKVFGQHYISAIRCSQFILGLLTAGVCALASLRLFGWDAARATFIFGLFLPTLVFSTAQVLTECLSAFLTALFLLFLVKQHQSADLPSAIGLGLVAGLESLFRFNAAALPLFAAWAVLRSRHRGLALFRTAAVLLVSPLIVLPWFIRNELVFQGHVLYSTQSGANAVQGVVSPQGRTQHGDSQKVKAAMGWFIRNLETNNAVRLSLPSEVELNRRALQVVPRLWREEGWNAIPLLGKKIADFWLSTDQFLDNKSLPPSDRLTRIAGVMIHLVVLTFAIGGLYQLRKTRPDIAFIFLVYATGLTILHLPFVMNTRLRIPLIDPLVVDLAGAGLTSLVFLMRHNQRAREQLLQAFE